MSFEFLKSIINESSTLGKIEGFIDPTTRDGANKFGFVTYDDREWSFTGKTGTNAGLKKPSFEYMCRDYVKHTDDRIWITIDGDITNP